MKFGDVCGAVDSGRPVAVPDGFSHAVLSAADSARRSGDLRWMQHKRIKAAVRNPRKLAEIYAGVVDDALAAGEIAASAEADGFDWDSLLAFIERLLPFILQLISIFG